MTKSVVRKCDCSGQSKYQDIVYGVGMRVFNYLAKKVGKPQQIRCTVCGTLKSEVEKD